MENVCRSTAHSLFPVSRFFFAAAFKLVQKRIETMKITFVLGGFHFHSDCDLVDPALLIEKLIKLIPN